MGDKTNTGIVLTAVMLASFTFFTGSADTPNQYYCEDSWISATCDSFSPFYSLPNGQCNNDDPMTSSKRCRSGWVEGVIDTPAESVLYDYGYPQQEKEICNIDGCKFIEDANTIKSTR